MNSNIPSRVEWGAVDPNDLDANDALETFLGKSFAEAQALFAQNALYYGEALQSMPPAAFNFYAPALAAYLLSDQARGDADGASSFFHTVIWVLKTRPEIVTDETKRVLMQAAEFVAKHQAHFEAGPEIYGAFSDRYAELQKVAEVE